MIEKISRILAKKIVLANGQKEDEDIYDYGLQILLNTLFSVSIVLGIGVIINELRGTIVFLICYCSIRLFAGGLHAKTNNRCMTLFIGGYIVASIILSNTQIFLNYNVICVLLLLNICILIWAPVDTPNNPVPKEKRIVMKKRAFFISSIITNVIFLLFYFDYYKVGRWAFAGVCWILFIFIAGKIKEIVNLRGDL